MDHSHAESFADAVKHGSPGDFHQETQYIVEEPLDDSLVYQDGGATTVREDDSNFGQQFQPSSDFQTESRDFRGRSSQEPREESRFSAGGGHTDFGHVVEGTRDELKNIVESAGGFNQNFGGGPDSFVQDSHASFDGGPAQSIHQRRSPMHADTGNSFPPLVPQFVNLNPSNGHHFTPRDDSDCPNSPMAEFDVAKRRNPSFGHHTSQRPRRSRPLIQHIRDLVFWRNAKDSGVIFSFGLVLLLSLSFFSIISIFAYLSMMSLILITSFVLMKQITLAFQQQTSEHPFKGLLDRDVVISPDYAHQQLDILLKPLNGILMRVRNLYLADSLGQTLKLIFVMYILTYVGSWFNLLTLLTIVWVGAFTLPKFYVTYKEQIDSVLHVVLEGLRDLKIQATHCFQQQLDKVKPRRADLNAGHIRTKGKEEVEVKISAGGAGSATKVKQEKKVTEKAQ